MNTSIQAIILAAGKSSRCKTGKTKLGEKICGQQMILYPTVLLEELHISTTVIIGYQKEYVQKVIKKKHGGTITFTTQDKQQGTGHALLCSQGYWTKDHLLIMNGDMPLVTKDIIEQLYSKHIENNAAISFVISHSPDPTSGTYGRVIQKDNHIKIVEAKDFQGDSYEHCCINAGIYLIKKEFLSRHIEQINNKNANKEFYITDLVQLASNNGYTVNMITAPFDCIRGVNTLQELWAAEQVKRAELIKYWMEHGVRFSVAQNVHIDLEVSIGAGSYVGCGVHLLGKTTIGKNCKINEFSSIENTTLEDNVSIEPHCIVKDSYISTGAQVGPFAYLRKHTHLDAHAILGTFVETHNISMGKHTQAKPLSYLGDATIGSNVTIGAGTITCNHDGKQKHQTKIEDNAYIGSNNSLVAPLTIQNGAYTAAGSVITENVPADALAIARSKQVNKKGYAKKLHEQTKKQHVTPSTSPDTNDNTHDKFSFIGASIFYDEQTDGQ